MHMHDFSVGLGEGSHSSGQSRFGQELGDQRAEGVADFG
jgi:hypothetical protein